VTNPRWLLLVALTAPVLTSLLAARPAQAGDRSARPVPTARARALELFEQSAKAYREGRFQDAIDLLLEARRVKPEPVLMYDLGRAYEALGNLPQAADSYATYLLEDPRAPDRRAIEIRIDTLRAQANELEKARTLPPPVEAKPLPPEPASASPSPPPRPANESGVAIVPWVVAGVGVVGLGAGVGLGLAAQARHRSAEAEPGQADAQRKQDGAESLATGATIALIAGGAVAAIGLGWLSVRLLTAGPTNVIAGPTSVGVRGVF
jgi:tetratricopeptide (TPR) repeat protein